LILNWLQSAVEIAADGFYRALAQEQTCPFWKETSVATTQ
jgi:hypothetical protein